MHISYEGEQVDQVIRKLYWEEELSQQLVGDRLGYSRTWVQKMMKKYNIPTRNYGEALINAIKHERIDFHENSRKAQETMNKEVSLGLRRWYRPGKYKSKIAALEEIAGKPFKEILDSLYCDGQMSCQQIAEYLNKIMAEIPGRTFKIHEGYVDRRLKMFGIPRRDISKATKLAMDKLSNKKKIGTDPDIFDKNDIEKRQTLFNLYWNQNYTQSMIAKKLGVSTVWVGKKMKELNIPRRERSQSRALAIKEGRIDLSEVVKKSNTTISRQVSLGERKWNRPGLYGDKIVALEKACGASFKEIIYYMYWDCGLNLQEMADSLSGVFNHFMGKTVNLTKSFVFSRMKKYGIPRRSSGETRNLRTSMDGPKLLNLRQIILLKSRSDK